MAYSEAPTLDKKPTLPAGMAGSPFDRLVGHENDDWPKLGRPAIPQSRITGKAPTPPARKHPTETSPNPLKPPTANQKTQAASHKKRLAVLRVNQPKTKNHSDCLTVTALDPNPTGRKWRTKNQPTAAQQKRTRQPAKNPTKQTGKTEENDQATDAGQETFNQQQAAQTTTFTTHETSTETAVPTIRRMQK